jgi:hypothetical protein
MVQVEKFGKYSTLKAKRLSERTCAAWAVNDPIKKNLMVIHSGAAGLSAPGARANRT